MIVSETVHSNFVRISANMQPMFCHNSKKNLFLAESIYRLLQFWKRPVNHLGGRVSFPDRKIQIKCATWNISSDISEPLCKIENSMIKIEKNSKFFISKFLKVTMIRRFLSTMMVVSITSYTSLRIAFDLQNFVAIVMLFLNSNYIVFQQSVSNNLRRRDRSSILKFNFLFELLFSF